MPRNTQFPILFFAALVLGHACGTGSGRKDVSGIATDSLLFVGEQQCLLRWKRHSRDSAMACVVRAEAIAQRMGVPWAVEKAEELRANVLVARNDTAAIAYCRALLEARRDAGPRALGTAHLQLGEAYTAWARYPEAIAEFEQAQAIAEQHGITSLLANALADRSAVYNNAGHSLQAIAIAAPYLRAHPDSGWTDIKVRLMGNLGAAYYQAGRMDSAVYWLERTLALKDVLSDTSAWIAAISNLANVHTMQGDYTPALDLLLQARQLAHRTGDARREAEVGYNLATVYEPLRRVEDAYREVVDASRIADSITLPQIRPRLRVAEAMLSVQFDSVQSARFGLSHPQRYERAIPEMHTAIAELTSNGDHFFLAATEAALGDMLILQKRPAEAKPLFEHALAVHTRYGFPSGITTANMGLGNVHFDLGDHGKAEPFYDKALAGLDQLGMKEYKAHLLDRLHTIYARKGQLAKALATLEQAKDESDRLRADSTTKAIADVEARFVFAKKEYEDSLRHASQVRALGDEREIAELKSQRANTRTALIGGGALLLVVGGGAAYRSDRRRRQARFERQATELRRQAAELENRALRAQMDPHFISNTLNAVNAGLHTNDTDAASTLLMRFAEWIRTMLETSRHDSITLRTELDALRTYLTLEQQRTDGKFTFSIGADPALDLDRVQVPPLIVQPFLENAIEHGFGRLEQGGELKVHAHLEGDRLRITVEDNGAGRRSAGDTGLGRKTSLSSTIIRERLQLLGERTGKPADYVVTDLAQGTHVEVVLPLV